MLAVLGHFVGDYLLQSKWMALTKSKPGAEGLLACTVHVAIYTWAVLMFVGPKMGPVTANIPYGLAVVPLVVFVPHWIIDRWSLATYWLRLIGGRTFEDARDPWDIAFTALVYTVVDNTMHVLCLYWGFLILVNV